MKGMRLAAAQKDGWRNIANSPAIPLRGPVRITYGMACYQQLAPCQCAFGSTPSSGDSPT